jgi:Fe-S-cluster-containing hydrogenase component 2/CRP-like cAMP-binding protein
MSILTVPSAPLTGRDAEVRLTDELLGELALIANLRRRPALYRFRGSVALRQYRAGETIIRQGDRGRSAFYILTASDVLAFFNWQLRSLKPRRPDPEILAAKEAVRQRLEFSAEPLATLRLVSSLRISAVHSDEPVSGALDPLYSTLREGELAGEAACLEGTPQPTTIVAVRDCHLLEMKADFLAAVLDDPVQKARADETYRTHYLRLQLGRLSLFRDLSDREFALISDAIELRTVSPGVLLCDEFERCDGLYLVRSGLVKLVKNVSALLCDDDVHDWTLLQHMLRDAAVGPSPRDAFWRRLSASARSILTKPWRPGGPEPTIRSQVLEALNELIVAVDLANEPELQELADGVLALGPGATARRANRVLFDAVMSPAIRPLGEARGPECVLNYCARGDAFGLSDLLLNRPCSATAIATGHPNALGRIDVAWLPAAAFWQLLREVPRLREPVKQETIRQRRQTERRLATPSWDDKALQFSDEAAELGLIQGQQLMLVDLDRCTRCDECVRACASSRDDGQSRLFLDGPRIGRYLVPTTCRACLDPVCLIGCPVGSIHRGPRQEIRIENWCIGCGLCSESCPYGAIQLHDLGVIPETTSGWRYTPIADASNHEWTKPAFRTARWLEGSTPFILDRTFREGLSESGLSSDARSFAFRYELSLSDPSLVDAASYRMEVQSGGDIRAWINGKELVPAERPRGSRHVYAMAAAVDGLRLGLNVLAINVVLSKDREIGPEPLLQARLDALRSDASNEIPPLLGGRPVTRQAAVCDLCADNRGGPACIHACPHDAVLRVDSRTDLPV